MEDGGRESRKCSTTGQGLGRRQLGTHLNSCIGQGWRVEKQGKKRNSTWSGENAHLVSRGGEVGCYLFVHIMDVLRFKRFTVRLFLVSIVSHYSWELEIHE